MSTTKEMHAIKSPSMSKNIQSTLVLLMTLLTEVITNCRPFVTSRSMRPCFGRSPGGKVNSCRSVKVVDNHEWEQIQMKVTN